MSGNDRPSVLIAQAERNVERIRILRPHVHCLTNTVAQHISANVLLAIGAVPSMTADVEVIGDFVENTASLVINLGMLDADRKASVPVAIKRANALGRPWLLDPVKIDRTQARRRYAQDLIALQPTAVRCNRPEFDHLFTADTGFAGVVATTGACDRVDQGDRAIGILNGNPIMDRVTAMGCAVSALCGAFLAVDDDPWCAVASALLVFGVAGDLAAENVKGPGSFEVALLDHLFALDPEILKVRAKFQ